MEIPPTYDVCQPARAQEVGLGAMPLSKSSCTPLHHNSGSDLCASIGGFRAAIDSLCRELIRLFRMNNARAPNALANMSPVLGSGTGDVVPGVKPRNS